MIKKVFKELWRLIAAYYFCFAAMYRTWRTGMYFEDTIKNHTILEYYVAVMKDKDRYPESPYERIAEEQMIKTYECSEVLREKPEITYENIRQDIAKNYATVMLSFRWKEVE